MNRIFSSLLLIGGLSQAADFSYVDRTQMTGGALVQMTGMLGRLAKGVNDPITTTHSYSGNKKASVSAKSHEIWDLDSETITSIREDAKEYSVITFAEMAQMATAMAERMSQQKPNTDTSQATAKWKASFDKNGQTKQVAGVTANGGTMKLELEGTDTKTGQTGVMKMDIDMWMGKLPGWEVKRNFDKRVGEKMGAQAGPQMAALAQAGAGAMEAMKEASKKISELGEMQLASVTKMYSDNIPNMPPSSSQSSTTSSSSTPQQPSGQSVGDAAKEEAARQAESEAIRRAGGRFGGLGGGLGGRLGGKLGQMGRKQTTTTTTTTETSTKPAESTTETAAAATPGGPGVLMELTTEVVSYSASADPSAFQIPAGYKQVEHPMKKAMSRSSK